MALIRASRSSRGPLVARVPDRVDYWLESLTAPYARGSKRPMAYWAKASLRLRSPKGCWAQYAIQSKTRNVNTTWQARSRLPGPGALLRVRSGEPGSGFASRRVKILPRCSVCRFCAALTTCPRSDRHQGVATYRPFRLRAQGRVGFANRPTRKLRRKKGLGRERRFAPIPPC